MKRVLLVNGVPASGKSSVARVLAQAGGWPLLTLDTVKEALFAHLGTGDRDYNRLLGKASYQAIFALIGDFPEGSTAVVDAWFGFQPTDVLNTHLEKAKISRVAEVWCHAPPAVIGKRYGSRLSKRHAGHLGESYVPELIELAGRAAPLGAWPLFRVDTTRPLDLPGLMDWVESLQ
ncbi:AAA family ATPase [Mesorhizobium sp. LHD-90]|uniref:AAA family ATPase n=1 Tax=Mesorhizobium sp. LHD-90 TaxID=3071414 RepID=UPI0027E027FB|nr:AAA family ATPase [Mesorhizobium sp. LHD-90]MDQ6435281.1 AAA family ATPase [Mesorhizobium sp. LHD-90]